MHTRADAFGAPLGEVCGVVGAAAAAQQRRLAAAAAGVQREVRALLRDGTTIMTTSLSSTLLEAVKEAAGARAAELPGWSQVAICLGRLLPACLAGSPAPCASLAAAGLAASTARRPCPCFATRSVHPAAGGLKLKAVVCEARPLCEGVALAAAWAAAGVEVTLVTDAQVGGCCLAAASWCLLRGRQAGAAGESKCRSLPAGRPAGLPAGGACWAGRGEQASGHRPPACSSARQSRPPALPL